MHTEIMPIRWGDMDAMGHVSTTILFAEGAAKVVWVDYEREKSVPLPDSIRKLIGH